MERRKFYERESKMVIKIISDGCPHCSKLYANAQKAAQELDMNITVEQETDIVKILQYRAKCTPAIIADGNIISEGEMLSVEKLKELFCKNN